ncbi:MAG: tetratricopeptide repeat protein [Vicingaceae bacterium]
MKNFLFVSLFLVSISTSARLNIDSLKQLLSTSSDTALINLHIEIGQAYIDLDVDSTLHYASIALPLANQFSFPKGKLMLNNLLGNCAQRKGDFDKAMEYYEQSRQIAEETSDAKGFAVVLNNIGIIHTQKGDYDLAIEEYLKALDYEKQIGDQKGIAEAYNNIGVVHYYMRDMENTLIYLKKSAKITEEIGDLQVLKKAYMNIGAIHQYNKQFEEALEFYEKGREIAKELNDLNDITIAHHNIAGVYQDQGKYEKAEEFYLKALAFNEKFENKRGIALEHLNLASLFVAKKDYKKAKSYYERAITLSTKEGYKEIISTAYSGLANMYEAQKQFKPAYENVLKHLLYKDSLLNEENTKSVTEMRTKYETAEKEKALAEEVARSEQIERAKVEAELKAANRTKWIFILIGLGVVITLIFLVVVQRNKRKAQAEKDAALIRERDKGMQAVFEAQEDERKRISKDLHDGIGQQLSGLKMAFQKLSGELKSSVPEKQKELEKLSGILHDSADEVRSISHQMMPKALTELGIIEAIDDMLEKSLGNSSISYEFEHFGIENRLNERVEVSLYRISQELINNIMKHSEAKKVAVQLFKNKGKVILIVEDNGKGIKKGQVSDGHGLLNIKSRLNSIHGEVNYEPSPQSGTIATVRIPIKS